LAYKPCSFLETDGKRHWNLYTTEALEDRLAHLRTLPAKTCAPLMQDMGLNTLDHALAPKFNPHFRYIEGSPQKEMHNEDDGLLRAENYQVLYVCFR
jgi:hypothetical protein